MPCFASHSSLIEPDVRISRPPRGHPGSRTRLSPQTLSGDGFRQGVARPLFGLLAQLRSLTGGVDSVGVQYGQAVLPSSDEACLGSGPFAPRALPRFFATMSRSDSRLEPGRRYAFRRPGGLTSGQAPPPGLPGSSTDLSARAAPNHPEEPDDCRCSSLRRRRRLHHLRRVGHSCLCNEAESGSRDYGSRVCRAGLRTNRVTPARARVATCLKSR